jgi:hypothetical protein
MLCQIPYNFQFGDAVLDFIYNNSSMIDSIYFGFENACRSMKHNDKTIETHLEKLKSLKKDLGIKLAYTLNTIIPVDLHESDYYILDSGIVDVVIVALDDVFAQLYAKYRNAFDYELSRFYFLIDGNRQGMLKFSKYAAFGFEKEVCSYFRRCQDVKKDYKLMYIANENCYPGCEFKMQHNKNQIERNNGLRKDKFNCPYQDTRKFYTREDIEAVHRKYPIDILKVCDRAFSDDRLLGEMKKWVGIASELA